MVSVEGHVWQQMLEEMSPNCGSATKLVVEDETLNSCEPQFSSPDEMIFKDTYSFQIL